MHPASRNALNSYGRQPRSVAPCMELLHSRSRGAAVGSRISSGTLPATFTSAFARCALRFVRWNAPQWSHGACIALTQAASHGGMGVIHYNLGAERCSALVLSCWVGHASPRVQNLAAVVGHASHGASVALALFSRPSCCIWPAKVV